MFEIKKKKCDLETIITNDSQYFWINLKDFEVESESNWPNIFNEHGNSSILKYRKELTPNIQFQPDKIFIRNDIFEKITKSCKATNLEFIMIKEKLEQEFVLPEIQDDIKKLKKENKESIEIKISEEPKEIKIYEESTEESTEEPIEIKSLKKMKMRQICLIKIRLKKY